MQHHVHTVSEWVVYCLVAMYYAKHRNERVSSNEVFVAKLSNHEVIFLLKWNWRCQPAYYRLIKQYVIIKWQIDKDVQS